ncbi:uncharacterized protein LOC120632863 [Pararge aegeria]|uniref:uncharacterized protein LOC120632863 n=1 Tax=Pararge aegeria TaxID=116150 RepID=UPI0019D24CCE|nr:uncharacterized protein LOC120632863 [Pararge aegeria]
MGQMAFQILAVQMRNEDSYASSVYQPRRDANPYSASRFDGLEGPQGEEETCTSALSFEKARKKIVLQMPVREEMDHESPMDSDSDTDRVLEALVGPWKATGAVSKRHREEVDSLGEEEGEPSEKAVAVEPEPVLVAKTKAKAKAGRGAYLGYSVAKARLKEMDMCSFETEAAADNAYRLNPPQTRSKTRSQRAEEEVRERSPIIVAEATPEAVDVYAPSRDELIDRARNAVSSITSEAKKSKNLRGGVRSEISRATTEIQKAMDTLQAMSSDEEARRLHADNRRMQKELAALRAEVKALRSSFSAREKSPTVGQPATDANLQTSPAFVEMLETLKRDLFVSIGGMVNDRLREVEKRLPQEPVLRPPLASGKKREKAAQRPLDEPSAGPSPARATTSCSAAGTRTTMPVPASQPERSVPVRGTVQRETEAAETTTLPTWSKVVGRKTKAKTGKSAMPKPKPAAQARVPANAKPRKGKLASPKSSAVVITLKQDAVATQSYATVMKTATSGLNLKDVGVDHVRVRKSATGARIIEVPGSSSAKAADELASKLQGLVGQWVTVARPIKTAELRLVGLDESITPEEVQRVVAEKGSVPVEQVRAGALRLGPNGTGSTLVRCPVTAAKLLIAMGRVVIGWSSARVTLLEPLPMRCYKCMGTGHTRSLCPSPVDRSTLCFRCGKEGHKSASCSVDPKCAVCTEIGRKGGHVMGGLKCSPPPTKGKEATFTRASETSRYRQEPAQEDFYMED